MTSRRRIKSHLTDVPLSQDIWRNLMNHDRDKIWRQDGLDTQFDALVCVKQRHFQCKIFRRLKLKKVIKCNLNPRGECVQKQKKYFYSWLNCMHHWLPISPHSLLLLCTILQSLIQACQFVFSTCLLAASWKKKHPRVEEHPDPLLLQAMF